MKTVWPILMIVLAIGIYYFGTDPLYNAPLVVDAKTGEVSGGVAALNTKIGTLSKALKQATELQENFTNLRDNVYNKFSKEDKERLDTLLPDTIDNVQLIIDINNIAAKYGMTIKNISIKADEPVTKKSPKTPAVSANKPSVSDTALAGAGSLAKGTVVLGFSVNGSYGAFQSFLRDLSNSLRLVDVSSLSFSADDKDAYQYNVELRTYWLK